MGCQGVRPKAQHVEDGRNPLASSGSVPCPMVADHGLCLRRKMTHQFLAWKNQNDPVESAACHDATEHQFPGDEGASSQLLNI